MSDNFSGAAKQFVLIDDDIVIQNCWLFAAKAADVQLNTYSTFDAFLNDIDQYPKDIFIYIDSNLSNNAKGETCAKLLFDKGYTNIYLATGYVHAEFATMPWIKSIVGKAPPFL